MTVLHKIILLILLAVSSLLEAKPSETSSSDQPSYGNIRHINHFREIAPLLKLPEDSSAEIRDFLSRSLLQLEQIAENNFYPEIFSRTFSGNAIVINGSTLNRSSQFYSFLDRVRESKKSTQPILISDHWAELKSFINEAYTKDTVVESFEYIVHSRNLGEGRLSAETRWTRVKQSGEEPPVINKGLEKFEIHFGGVSPNLDHTTVLDNKPITNYYTNPISYGVNGPTYKESYVVQKSSESGPVIYVTHVYIKPDSSQPSESTGYLLPKDTPEVAKLKAEHLALKESLEKIIKSFS